MAPWFSASAVASPLGAEWGLGRLGLPTLTIAVQLGFAIGALVIAATAAADVISPRALFATGAIGRRARQPRVRLRGIGRPDGRAVPVRHRACPGRRLPDRAEAARWLVPQGAGPGDRRARGCPHDRLRVAVPAARDRREPGRRLAGDRGSGQRRRGHRRLAGARGGIARSLGCARAAVQPRCRPFGAAGAIGPAREPGLPRPHVGALRDVDLGAAVPRRELRRGR